MSLFAFKLLAAVATFVVAILGGLLPLRIGFSDVTRRFFSLANALAGGILLGTGTLHMLGDSVELLDGVVDYPLAYLLCSLGFVAMLLIGRAIGGPLPALGQERPVGAMRRRLIVYLLMLMLSVHSFVAGIAMGLDPTLAGAVVIFIAIIVHKGSAAFALGVNLGRSRLAEPRQRSMIWLFAAVTPLGILLGELAAQGLAEQIGAHARMLEGVFDGLAAGTFLYISIFEILGEELESRADRGLKIVLITAGLALMAWLALYV